ncbi:hypothetical protein CAEBREN_00231 [Caenorhabditis brenneri]|uniref:NR LBD domain-containing protein n=1 Tax=Caenorhabditis brenneri TaxID=135651 RepID=G0M932_CAEBE|nr:hypothetical protein CAEBREN_00231 [Caenorhabditis brenneri]
MDLESSIYSTSTSSETTLSEIPNPDSLNSEFPEKRCHFSPVIEQRKCRLLNGKCGPNRNGRWFCKKCRLERCLELGMTTTNIQYDRDAFKSSVNFVKSQALARLVGDRIGVPMQFVFSPDNLVDYDKMDSDISCWSSHTFDEMRFFFIPKELYYDDVIWDIIDIQPSDVELTFIMSILCFQLAGTRYGGHIQDEMERLQDILSNELHEYYMKNNQKMYLLRLKQLMKVKERFLRLRNIRLEKYSLGGIFNMFNTSFSNPDFFWVPP